MRTDDTATGGHRFDDLEIASGDVVIYDTENRCAWVQSDAACRLEEMT